MKIYVAGKNLERAQKVIEALRGRGHEITYDWVAAINNRSDMIKKASDERKAIQESEVLVYLWESDQESARYEAGMAMGLNKEIIVSGCEEAHFFRLPEVRIAKNDAEIPKILNG